MGLVHDSERAADVCERFLRAGYLLGLLQFTDCFLEELDGFVHDSSLIFFVALQQRATNSKLTQTKGQAYVC